MNESCVKCPVCDKENPSMLCARCGFDSSKDYGKYPTFGPVGQVPSVSALRNEWKEKQKPEEPQRIEEAPAEPRKKNKVLPLLIAATCAVVLGLGIWIGSFSQNLAWRENVLKADDPDSHYVYGTEIYKYHVTSVTLQNIKGHVAKCRFLQRTRSLSS